jgi:hypothetical protein
MNLDVLRAARYRQPFVPFVLRLTDGTEVEVDDWAAISITQWHILVAKPDCSFELIPPDRIQDVVYPSGVA